MSARLTRHTETRTLHAQYFDRLGYLYCEEHAPADAVEELFTRAVDVELAREMHARALEINGYPLQSRCQHCARDLPAPVERRVSYTLEHTPAKIF